MSGMGHEFRSSYFATLLRRELSELNQAYARRNEVSHELSYGEMPVVIYAPDEQGMHGNFLRESYSAILSDPGWKRRLDKIHTHGRISLPRSDRRWCELDSSASSDALLMNVFCHPEVLDDGKMRALLSIDDKEPPEFGFKARVPLVTGRFDRTEVDMRLGNLLVEAKLTENDFQSCELSWMNRYRDFETVFDYALLPRCGHTLLSYQLLRNVLAAHNTGASFCLIADARRLDLFEAWHAVMQAVIPCDLRLRLKTLTWQELAEAVPRVLQEFLSVKYGIVAGEVLSTHTWVWEKSILQDR